MQPRAHFHVTGGFVRVCSLLDILEWDETRRDDMKWSVMFGSGVRFKWEVRRETDGGGVGVLETVLQWDGGWRSRMGWTTGGSSVLSFEFWVSWNVGAKKRKEERKKERDQTKRKRYVRVASRAFKSVKNLFIEFFLLYVCVYVRACNLREDS